MKYYCPEHKLMRVLQPLVVVNFESLPDFINYSKGQELKRYGYYPIQIIFNNVYSALGRRNNNRQDK